MIQMPEVERCIPGVNWKPWPYRERPRQSKGSPGAKESNGMSAEKAYERPDADAYPPLDPVNTPEGELETVGLPSAQTHVSVTQLSGAREEIKIAILECLPLWYIPLSGPLCNGRERAMVRRMGKRLNRDLSDADVEVIV